MNKRILSAVMCVIMVMLLLCSCKEQTNGDPTETTAATEATTTAATTAATTVATTEEDDGLGEGIYIARPDKKVKNILMIGNSFCYYYVEELAGIAAADGNEIVVANLYKSGCQSAEHWNNYSNNKSVYEFYVTNSIRRTKQSKVTTMQGALDYAKQSLGGNWDVITLQQSCLVMLDGDAEAAKAQTLTYTKDLYDVIKTKSPTATLYWHQPWAYAVGYSGINNKSDQTAQYEAIKAVATAVAAQNGVNVVPTGDAWQIARENVAIGDTLCQSDKYHDGDTGGGQYLNACVWYEILMGESCVGNTWRPRNYSLSEEKIAILQNAAHEAVAAVYGPNYAQ